MVPVPLASLAAMANVPAAPAPVSPPQQLQLLQEHQVSEGFFFVCAWFVKYVKIRWKNDDQVPHLVNFNSEE